MNGSDSRKHCGKTNRVQKNGKRGDAYGLKRRTIAKKLPYTDDYGFWVYFLDKTAEAVKYGIFHKIRHGGKNLLLHENYYITQTGGSLMLPPARGTNG